MNNLLALNGKRFVITGGTKGIGRSISEHLLNAGASIICNYVRDKKAADEFLQTCDIHNDQITLCRADLTREHGIERLLASIAQQPIDGLIHCAATGIHKPLEELTMRHWDWTMSLNLRAFFELVIKLRPSINAGGSIIAISSEGAQRAVPYYTLVGTSKAGLESLCRHLSFELAKEKIRVNVISSGSIVTQAWDVFPDKEERIMKVKKGLPDGEMLLPEEVAKVALFLCSDASSGINAHTLVVDKGERVLN